MRVVYKYPLQDNSWEFGSMNVPEGEVVLVAGQNGILHAWIDQEVDEVREMYLTVVGTGHATDENMVHKGSAIVGDYVWHVYRYFA